MVGRAVGDYAADGYGVYGLGWSLDSSVASPDDPVVEGDSSGMAAADAVLGSPAG